MWQVMVAALIVVLCLGVAYVALGKIMGMSSYIAHTPPDAERPARLGVSGEGIMYIFALIGAWAVIREIVEDIYISIPKRVHKGFGVFVYVALIFVISLVGLAVPAPNGISENEILSNGTPGGGQPTSKGDLGKQ
ncbi:hypothetical protein [Bradyrhizobium sp. SZCCHNRI3042]|uniref:hypothetical protein n=1 Tax=Bradyrhizobium sp. SZCCHNRI3042 TaxID=3057291 RepID=UPI0029161776|nr:hypothetical protein [Bradyrhizobium sp. SZCCHNRI3042]